MEIIAQKTNTKALILLDLLVGIVLTGGIAIFLPVYVFSIDASLLTNFYVWAFVLGCILFFGLIAYFFSLRPLLLFSRLPQVQAETDGTYLYIHSTKEAKIPLAEMGEAEIEYALPYMMSKEFIVHLLSERYGKVIIKVPGQGKYILYFISGAQEVPDMLQQRIQNRQ